MDNKKNISKLEKLFQDSAFFRAIVVSILFMIISFMMIMVLSGNALSNSHKTASMSMTEDSFFLISIPVIFIGIISWSLLGDDIKKGKIESEILKGSSKKRIFLSKVIALTLFSGFVTMLLTLLPVLVVALLYGWGDIVNKSDIVIRVLLMFFPYLRIAAFFGLIVLAFKNLFVTLFTSIAEIVVFGILLSPLTRNSYITGYENVMQLFAKSNWTSYEFSNKDGFIEIVGSSFSVSTPLVLKTISISLLVVLLYFAISFWWFKKVDRARLLYRILFIVSIAAGYLIVFIVNWNIHHTLNYAEEFDNAFNQLKEHYVLAEEKRIDWDRIYDKYYPEFKMASRKSDEAGVYKLWMQFCDEFKDGHVFFNQKTIEKENRNICATFGNDYGLSLIKLDSGDFVAFNVEGCPNCYSILDEEQPYSCSKEFLSKDSFVNRLNLYNSGVRNGTVITKWDGIDIEELCQRPDVFMQRFADKTNREYYTPVYAAGYGGEIITITFINDNGLEEQVSVSRLGAYASRLKNSLDRLDAGYDTDNISWVDLDRQTVLFRLSAMNNDSQAVSEEIENFEVKNFDDVSLMNNMKLDLMIDDVRKQIEEYKKNGKKNIIIDLRGNLGGNLIVSLELAALFAPVGNMDLCYSAKINKMTACYERGSDGRYEKYDLISRPGKDIWHDGNIILLVNNETMSAGDIFTYLMAKFPNVTIMGITRTNSSSQATDTIMIDCGSIKYAAIPLLNNDGTALIDTDYRQIGNVPIDVLIPTDEVMIKAIFDEGKDYVLGYAIDYLA